MSQTHLDRTYEKLAVKNRRELSAVARDCGLIDFAQRRVAIRQEELLDAFAPVRRDATSVPHLF